MSESWRDLMRPVGEVEPSIDLLSQIHRREAELPVGRPRGFRLPRLTGWVLAGVGCLLVLGVLAVAAHSRGNTPPAPAEPRASYAKLRVLRETYANHRFYRPAGPIAELASRFPIALIRPDVPLASDASVDSVWVSTAKESGARSIAVIWKSGVVETFERWRCNCEAAASLKQVSQRKPFRFMMLRGAPAMTAPSNPGERGQQWLGPLPLATQRYGVPASVETIRDGYNITLWQYGGNTQLGLIAAARTLPPAQAAFDVDGYEAGREALGDWNGGHGIDVSPQGGARFGIGVALKNVTGHPLTITGVHALNGFIRLIGTHFRAYTPPTGSAVGPPITQAPYNTTAPDLNHQLPPGRWVGMQLDFQIQNPCVHWSQTIYDRTVEVTYTQDGIAHIQEVPLVPLNITRPRHSC
jgi:hypothetical protein